MYRFSQQVVLAGVLQLQASHAVSVSVGAALVTESVDKLSRDAYLRKNADGSFVRIDGYRVVDIPQVHVDKMLFEEAAAMVDLQLRTTQMSYLCFEETELSVDLSTFTKEISGIIIEAEKSGKIPQVAKYVLDNMTEFLQGVQAMFGMGDGQIAAMKKRVSEQRERVGKYMEQAAKLLAKNGGDKAAGLAELKVNTDIIDRQFLSIFGFYPNLSKTKFQISGDTHVDGGYFALTQVHKHNGFMTEWLDGQKVEKKVVVAKGTMIFEYDQAPGEWVTRRNIWSKDEVIMQGSQIVSIGGVPVGSIDTQALHERPEEEVEVIFLEPEMVFVNFDKHGNNCFNFNIGTDGAKILPYEANLHQVQNTGMPRQAVSFRITKL